MNIERPPPAFPAHVAIVGAGIAGAACAQRLLEAGCSVTVFDKSRGVGGRMATRRTQVSLHGDEQHLLRFDHGAPAFSATSPAFRAFVDAHADAGRLARWEPALAPRSYEPLERVVQWVGVPDAPSLARALLRDVPVWLNTPVTALAQEDRRWRLSSEVAGAFSGFDAVVLAVPAAQAAPLLQPHRADWAHAASHWPIQPTWTLMGLSAAVDTPALGRPAEGPLAWVMRDDLRPGRPPEPDGRARWVLHATPAWSQTHLDAPPQEVQAALQSALARWLGRPLDWRWCTVHRWRYATVPRREAQVPGHCWWDDGQRLGVCGDFLGGSGVEGAWTSGSALAERLLQDASP